MLKPLEAQPDFVKLEHQIQRFWREKQILRKYLARNKSSPKRFSFLDGPITANNPMGVHHAWGRSLKDLYQRFKNMRGYQQRFQNGFDNQGLWVEVEVEKKLGFKNKKDIEKFGIARFVEECKKHTLHFAKKQTEQSQRLGYFMDWGNDYYTMSEENNYAIWHFLKKVWQDGNLYKGRDSVPWCPRCGTAISQHEILNEEYQELTHQSIYFNLPVVGQENEYFLVWTTTPWTLPANVALAVHPDLTYSLVERDGARYWLASALMEKLFGKDAKIIKQVTGRELEGRKYSAPFDSLPRVREARRENEQVFHTVVLSEEYVNDEEGTGIVHIAPGCGEEDFALGKEIGLPVLAIIGESAEYLDGLGDLTGKNAKNDPQLILRHPSLTREIAPKMSFIFKITPYTHRYPTCWRCKSELVWRVVDEWYIKMDNLRHQMMAVTEQIRWIPSYGRELELDWLRNMHDWLISKKRYWGLALPIWECACGHFEVIGSKEELKERAVAGWEEFSGHTPHRPFVDAVKIKCSRCGKQMERVKDVGNPWLDAGIVAYSTLGYFSNRGYWEKWFPADLVLECFPGQFKNWFYALIAMSAVLENKPPFKTLLGHALVRDERGEEMHKSKGNAIWFDEAAEKMGADVMRWMYAKQNPTRNLNFGYQLAEETKRRFFLILWNSARYFVTFANLCQWQGREGELPETGSLLDKWIISRVNTVARAVTEELEDYQNHKATELLESFVVSDLSGWYIRRSRGRKEAEFFATGDYVFRHLLLMLAPIIPHTAERLYQSLGGNKESIHLENWLEGEEKLIDKKLEREMEFVRAIVEKGRSARREAQIKVRQPLARITVSSSAKPLADGLCQLIKDELNIKEVVFAPGKELAVKLDTKITPELALEGEMREFSRETQKARKSAQCRLTDLVVLEYPREYQRVVDRFDNQLRQSLLVKEFRPGGKFHILS